MISIESEFVPDLTLVDLPGIVRTHTEGQSHSVIADVDGILHEYLSQRHTIVLAVVPANVDVATVDILERAKRFDPEGDRTIGVITKPDLVDIGAEDAVCSTLQNITKPLKLGYVMVKNRGQRDLAENTSIRTARDDEMRFFSSHSVYSSLPSHLLGIQSLTLKCTEILVDRIIAELPGMAAEAKKQLADTNAELEAMGAPPPTAAEAERTTLQTLNDYCDLFANAIQGVYNKPPLNSAQSYKLCAIARNYFDQLKTSIYSSKPNFNDPERIQQLQQIIRDSRGLELPGFLNATVFNELIKEYVHTWELHTKECLEKVYSDCVRIANELCQHICPKFAVFRRVMKDTTNILLAESKQTALFQLEQVIDEEARVPFTQNDALQQRIAAFRAERSQQSIEELLTPYGFHNASSNSHQIHMDTSALVRIVSDWYGETPFNRSNETAEAELMNAYLASYWEIATSQLIDRIPKLIARHLLQKSAENIRVVLYKPCNERKDELFGVSTVEVDRRYYAEQKKVRLASALKLMQSFD